MKSQWVRGKKPEDELETLVRGTNPAHANTPSNSSPPPQRARANALRPDDVLRLQKGPGNGAVTALASRRAQDNQNRPANTAWVGREDQAQWWVKATRESYQITREKYKLHFGSTITQGPKHKPLDTSDWGWASFVMESQGEFLVFQDSEGLLESRALAGGAVAGMGKLKATNGKLEEITNQSDPTLGFKTREKETMQVLTELKHRGVLDETLKLLYDGAVYPGGALAFYEDHGGQLKEKMKKGEPASLP